MTLADHARKLKYATTSPRWAFLMTDARLSTPEQIMRKLPPGAVVVVRAKDPLGVQALAQRLSPLIRQRRLQAVVSGQWRLAEQMSRGAARPWGVHLPESLAAHGMLAGLRLSRKRRGSVLTVACHSPRALAQAARLRADAALLSPILPTASHPFAPVIGWSRAGLWSRKHKTLPILALGGITRRSIRGLSAHGFSGFAAVGGW